MSLHNFFCEVSLEQDAQENFNDVIMKTPMRMPVELKVGSSHIRITSVRLCENPLFPESLTDR